MAFDSPDKKFFRGVKQHPENYYIIHYSSQGLNDSDEGLSPGITSIAVQHVATDQVNSFSTHAIAEELHIPQEEVRTRFDEVEREILVQFYNFARDRRDKFWIHWNMRNLTYGFEHIAHRYRVVTGKDAPIIPVEHQVNLNDVLNVRYGDEYAAHPKLPSLMELNGGRRRGFLTGGEEADAFRNGDFIRMHNSTLVKTGFFSHVIRMVLKGKLRTNSKGFLIFVDRLLESRLRKVITLAAAVLSIFAAVISITLCKTGSWGF